MKTHKSILSRICAIAFVVALNVSCYGITITPNQPGATTLYDASDPYVITGMNGVVSLNPLSATLLARGGTAGLLNLLVPFSQPVGMGGGGWTFTTAAADLNGKFNIDVYDAFVNAAVNPNSVGANFAMDFVAGAGDPAGVVFHWIQRVFDNHAFDGAHGVNEDLIDATTTSALTNPGRLFYDFDVAFATPPHFEDSPRRPDPQNFHSWNAELYLVSIPNVGSKNVTIYNGVSWGWTNSVPDTGDTLMLLVLSAGGLLIVRWRSHRRASRGSFN